MPNVHAHCAPQSGYAPVNGLNLYYQIQGRGKPLVLLHGGVAAIEMFGENLPLLAEGRQVIGIDLQALAGMAQMGPDAAEPMKETPMYQTYASIAPNVEASPVLPTKL